LRSRPGLARPRSQCGGTQPGPPPAAEALFMFVFQPSDHLHSDHLCTTGRYQVTLRRMALDKRRRRGAAAHLPPVSVSAHAVNRASGYVTTAMKSSLCLIRIQELKQKPVNNSC